MRASRGAQNGFTALAAAAGNGKASALVTLLEAASQRAKDTALLMAASRQATDSVKALIAAGAKATAKKETTLSTALHYNMSNCEINTEITALLIAAGGDVNAADEDGRTPLMTATDSPEAVRLLLSAGADATAVSNSGCSVLYYACQSGGAPVVATLLEAGAAAGVNAAGSWGYTPLMLAARRSDGAAEVVKLLLARGANKAAKDEDGRTAAEMAEDEEVKALLQ